MDIDHLLTGMILQEPPDAQHERVANHGFIDGIHGDAEKRSRHLFAIFGLKCPHGCFQKIGVPPNHPFVHRVFHYKPSVLGYHYFLKHPYVFGESLSSRDNHCILCSIESGPTAPSSLDSQTW